MSQKSFLLSDYCKTFEFLIEPVCHVNAICDLNFLTQNVKQKFEFIEMSDCIVRDHATCVSLQKADDVKRRQTVSGKPAC